MRNRFAALLIALTVMFGGAASLAPAASAVTISTQAHQMRLCNWNLASFSLWWGCYLTGYCRVC